MVSARRAAALAMLLGALTLGAVGSARAGSGKLLLTGGVSSIDGAAGGGISPWALTGSYASAGEFGATAHVSGLKSRDFSLVTAGALLSWNERLELSLARQDLDTGPLLAPLGLGGLHLKQDIAGAKLRLFGDAVLNSDNWEPQVAAGLLHKRADPGALGPTLFGALGASPSGNEFYLSATKLLLGQGVLVNGTLRWSRANQNGLLGFGGAQATRQRVLPELSVAWLWNSRLAIGAEWRAKPDHLNRSVLGEGALRENDWSDVFVAWTPSKQFSLTAAVVDLGRIVPALQPRRQTGAYLSAQAAF